MKPSTIIAIHDARLATIARLESYPALSRLESDELRQLKVIVARPDSITDRLDELLCFVRNKQATTNDVARFEIYQDLESLIIKVAQS